MPALAVERVERDAHRGSEHREEEHRERLQDEEERLPHQRPVLAEEVPVRRLDLVAEEREVPALGLDGLGD